MPEGAIGMTNLLVLGGLMFVIGLTGFLVRRNLLVMFLSAEVMFQGVILTLVAFGRYHGLLSGQAFALFVVVLAAVEAALGLGLVVLMFRRSHSLDAEAWKSMKEF